MKRYSYNYEAIIHFSATVKEHSFKLKCMPCQNDFQTIIKKEFQLLPNTDINYDRDIFNNPIQYGIINEAHNIYVFISSGIVEQTHYCI